METYNFTLKNFKNRLTYEEIIERTCSFFDVKVGHILGVRRDGDLCEVRHIICDILYSARYLNLTNSKIGKILGRHHSTVITSHNKVRNYCRNDEEYRSKVLSIYHELFGNFDLFRH
jgi:chromosomal replication initiation ATPase DnaA